MRANSEDNQIGQHGEADGEASECALLPPGHPLGDAAAAAATRQPILKLSTLWVLTLAPPRR